MSTGFARRGAARVNFLLIGWGAALGGVALAGVFAQAGAELKLDPGISSLVSNLGVIGVLVWYLWYDTTVARPKRDDQFLKESQSQRESAALEIKAMRETFEAEQRAMRDQHARDMAEMRQMHLAAIKEFRTAVHDMRDAGQVTLNKVQQIAAQAQGADPRATPKPGG